MRRARTANRASRSAAQARPGRSEGEFRLVPFYVINSPPPPFRGGALANFNAYCDPDLRTCQCPRPLPAISPHLKSRVNMVMLAAANGPITGDVWYSVYACRHVVAAEWLRRFSILGSVAAGQPTENPGSAPCRHMPLRRAVPEAPFFSNPFIFGEYLIKLSYGARPHAHTTSTSQAALSHPGGKGPQGTGIRSTAIPLVPRAPDRPSWSSFPLLRSRLVLCRRHKACVLGFR